LYQRVLPKLADSEQIYRLASAQGFAADGLTTIFGKMAAKWALCRCEVGIAAGVSGAAALAANSLGQRSLVGRGLSPQQRGEASLLEMFVAREGFGEALVAHHDKGNTVN
jgi:hypothetical protein